MIKKEHIAFLAAIILMTACNPTKRLAEGEYLLRQNQLVTNGIDLSKEELQGIIKQQPNRKILGVMRFHLHMYNLPTTKRLRVSREKKNERIARKNERRAAKGKPLKDEGRTKWEYFKEVVGEPPVLLDTSAARISSNQLSTYLVRKGYFINEVSDSIVLNEKKKMATVIYKFNWEAPYILDSLRRTVRDPGIAGLIDQTYSYEYIELGKRFDVDRLADEREHLTSFLRNRGYYLLTHDYIEFEVDSTLGGNRVGVNLILRPPTEGTLDSLGLRHHQSFQLGEVYFNYELPHQVQGSSDTLFTTDYKFLGAQDYPLKTKVLEQNTFLTPGQLYQHEKVERTYRRLASLPPLSHVVIRFEPKGSILDTYITMTPSRRQSFSIEGQGTNSSGFLGIEGNLVYRHRNIFKGAELLEIKFRGGVQSQVLITDNSNTSDFEQSDNITFNTIEFGPSVSLRFPKFLLPVKMERFAKSANPTTVLSAAYSYQNRPDFERNLSTLSFGYEWRETVKKSHKLNVFEASIIRIDKSPAFQNQLDLLNDRFLSDSYRNHFITASTYTYTYNGQEDASSKNILYFRGTAEVGGNLLRAAFRALGQPKDSLGSYEIVGIRFANFAKAYTDTRVYRRIDESQTLVGRVALGVGVPYGNLNVLPFSKSFFGGGANGIRAWKARTIGPGSFNELVVSYDKIGDVTLEANLEYRFNLIDYLDAAFFIDAGNIWLLGEDKLRPGGDLQTDRFLSEIAIGAGLGFRLDFNFFILRFDLGGQFKDPALVPGERWLFQPKTTYNESVEEYNANLTDGLLKLNPYRFRLNLNLGIGYPF